MTTAITTPANLAIEGSSPNKTLATSAKIRKWVVILTPRIVVITLGAYYGLGLAYYWGMMAAIDRVAIEAIRHFAGYAGIGAMMPTVQWYSSLAVRGIMATGAEFCYEIVEKLALKIIRAYRKQ
jgi:hypothetical protein